MNATQGIGEWVPLELRTLSDGIGVEGLTFDAVGLQITYQKPGGVVTVFTPTVVQWREGHLGSYQVFLPDTVISDTGTLLYWATYTDSLDYSGWIEVYTAEPNYGIGSATYIDGIRARGIAVADISDVDLTSIIGEALFEYSRYRPLIVDTTFLTVADQQKYTWTEIGDASGIMSILCLYNPSADADIFSFNKFLNAEGLYLDVIGDRSVANWHYPSMEKIFQIKNTAFHEAHSGTGYQTDIEGGDIWLTPCPTDSGITVFILYTKPHATVATVKTSDRDIFLDCVEAAASSHIANDISRSTTGSDIKTPEYEVKSNALYKYWVGRSNDSRCRFMDKCHAGFAPAART